MIRWPAEEQNQATRAEIERLTKYKAVEADLSHKKTKGNIKPLVSNESVAEALQERLAAGYREQQENIRRAGQ